MNFGFPTVYLRQLLYKVIEMSAIGIVIGIIAETYAFRHCGFNLNQHLFRFAQVGLSSFKVALFLEHGLRLVEVREPVHPGTGKPVSLILVGELPA